MNLIHALILGVVEGLTEFLPISSTAHLMLTVQLLEIEKSEFVKTFEIAIQPGAILAVVVLYWRALLVEWETIKRVVLAFVPTALLGLLFYKVIKSDFLENERLALGALAVGGVVMIVFELFYKEPKGGNNNDSAAAASSVATIPYWQCLALGVFQCFAFIPGVSRAAATILGAMALGRRRKTAVEFSFLLAVPTMAAATALDLIQTDTLSYQQTHLLGAGFIASFVVALVAVKFLLRFIRTHTFAPFGVYRILLAAILWMVLR